MITLGIDTSTMRTSVGLIKDSEEIASYELTWSVNNSEEIVNMIKDIFKKTSLSISDVDLFAVGVGPGSFTGTRIAVTVARTFAQALNKEIVKVSSLMATAMTYEGDRTIIPLIDAKRGRAYYGIYKNKEDIEEIKKDDFKNIEDIVGEVKGEKIVLVGPDSLKFKEEFKDLDVEILKFGLIRGANIAKLGEKTYKDKGGNNLLEVLPNYIVKSQAERELGK